MEGGTAPVNVGLDLKEAPAQLRLSFLILQVTNQKLYGSQEYLT